MTVVVWTCTCWQQFKMQLVVQASATICTGEELDFLAKWVFGQIFRFCNLRTHIHAYIHMYIYIYMYIYNQICIYTCSYIYMYLIMFMCSYTFTSKYEHVCKYNHRHQTMTNHCSQHKCMIPCLCHEMKTLFCVSERESGVLRYSQICAAPKICFGVYKRAPMFVLVAYQMKT